MNYNKQLSYWKQNPQYCIHFRTPHFWSSSHFGLSQTDSFVLGWRMYIRFPSVWISIHVLLWQLSHTEDASRSDNAFFNSIVVDCKQTLIVLFNQPSFSLSLNELSLISIDRTVDATFKSLASCDQSTFNQLKGWFGGFFGVANSLAFVACCIIHHHPCIEKKFETYDG